jgi:hypothetical protein
MVTAGEVVLVVHRGMHHASWRFIREEGSAMIWKPGRSLRA